MQFKHPDILWGLLLLLIPLIVHLLQLRRFKKTPFTNVAMLKKVVSESKKSQNLKKWLLLLTRMLLLTALVLAFAQPFRSKADALTQRETVIYLDDSFSMQLRKDGLSLLKKSVQDLIQSVPETAVFSLFTNGHTFNKVTVKQIQDRLLALESTPKQLTLDQISLKAQSLFSNDGATLKNFLLVSDLQERIYADSGISKGLNLHIVQPQVEQRKNVFIDSIYLGSKDDNQIPLHVQVVGLNQDETVPISLFDGNNLIAKTAVKGSGRPQSTSVLSLQSEQAIQGRLVIEDPVLGFDNNFYFNIEQRNRPKILVISESDASFLGRIFSKNRFDFNTYSTKDLNYSILGSQNTIILNGLERIPSSLSTALKTAHANGTSLVVVPTTDHIDIPSYNDLIQGIAGVQIKDYLNTEQQITQISFQHPLYANVFEKRVDNFDYPRVNGHLQLAGNMPRALSYADGSPFLLANRDFNLFTAALDPEHSNFVNSPLIVPTFYNIGENSLKSPSLYQTIGKQSSIDVEHRLGNDNILKVVHKDSEFIPLQQSFSNKVNLSFGEHPKKDGIYAVVDAKDTLQHLSFNYAREESVLQYLDPKSLNPSSNHSGIPDFFRQLQQDTSIDQYWKWFVIFALLFALLEVLIQKLFP